MQMQLRPYQEKLITDTRAAYGNGAHKVMLSAATGAGKTVMALDIVKSALNRGKKVAFVVDKLALLDQSAKVFYQNGFDFGIIQGQNQLTNFTKQFQICSAQTLIKRNVVEDFDFIIIDEAHVTYKGIAEKMKGESSEQKYLGLTATPFTRGLGKIWQKLIWSEETRTAALIDTGFLSKYVAYGPTTPDLSKVRIRNGEYVRGDLAKAMTKQLYGDIFEHWQRLAGDRRTVAAAVDVDNAELMAQEFLSHGIKASVIHCYLPKSNNGRPGEAELRIEAFRKGDIQVLCSVDMISRGFDMPAADCLIAARPTRSLNYHIQMMGRVLRWMEGKEYAIILDHAGNIERLGFPDDEFDMYLSTNEKGTQADHIKKERKEVRCPKCSNLKKSRECPKCGFVPERKTEVDIDRTEKLKQIERDKKTAKQKLNHYKRLLACAAVMGYAKGWAAHKYKEKYNVWPRGNAQMDGSTYEFLIGQPEGLRKRMVWSMVKGKKKKVAAV
jgi:superfamily II DNA or RNA helicase